MVPPLAADCPEFNTSVLRVDFCKMNTRWYVLLIECQVGFCVAHFEDGIPRRLANLCSFARHVCVHVVLGDHRLFRFLDGCIHLDPPPRTNWCHPLPSYAARDQPIQDNVNCLVTRRDRTYIF